MQICLFFFEDFYFFKKNERLVRDNTIFLSFSLSSAFYYNQENNKICYFNVTKENVEANFMLVTIERAYCMLGRVCMFVGIALYCIQRTHVHTHCGYYFTKTYSPSPIYIPIFIMTISSCYVLSIYVNMLLFFVPIICSFIYQPLYLTMLSS